MNKFVQIIVGGVFAAQGAFAQQVAPAQDNTLQSNASNAAVQQVLSQPDGVAIAMKDDGSFQIFARGTGVYDFDDPDDINDARKEGTLKAKAALTKFMKEKLSTEEGFDDVSKKSKSMSSDGKVQSVAVSKETVKVTTEKIRNSADAILTGVITLREQKVARAGTTGEIQITVGVSSKTLAAASKLANGIQNSLDSRKPAAGAAGVAQPPAGAAGKGGNYSEVKEAKTDF